MPGRCDPGMTWSAPSSTPHGSRWIRNVIMFARTDDGGWTWTIPALADHGPNPATGARRLTAMARSWCQVTDQFDSGVLSNSMARTAKASGESTRSTTSRTGADRTNARVAGEQENRHRTPPRRRFSRGMRSSSSRHRSSQACGVRNGSMTAYPRSTSTVGLTSGFMAVVRRHRCPGDSETRQWPQPRIPRNHDQHTHSCR